MNSKFIQIAANAGGLYALDEDGAVWIYSQFLLSWIQLSAERKVQPAERKVKSQ
jgi:hypothetical protein